MIDRLSEEAGEATQGGQRGQKGDPGGATQGATQEPEQKKIDEITLEEGQHQEGTIQQINL